MQLRAIRYVRLPIIDVRPSISDRIEDAYVAELNYAVQINMAGTWNDVYVGVVDPTTPV
jgi:hypothetical protein